MLAIVLICFIYGSTSFGLTFINKQLYTSFGEVSPMNLLMLQCFLNLTICLVLMFVKEMRKSTFSSLR